RLTKPDGTSDSRTPALWASGGTGRDGKDRKDAPKLGWCWWNNRHTWLGVASAGGRTAGGGEGPIGQESRSCLMPCTTVPTRQIRITGVRSTVTARNGRSKIPAITATRIAIATR